MKLTERFRKFPVSFYKDINTNKITYDSAFTQGEANSLDDAFKEFSRTDFVRDLYYYYDDVVDVRVGRYIPALNDKVRKGKQYLGKLEIEIDIDKSGFGDKSKEVSYLNKHRDEIPKQLDWIKKMKREEKIDKIKSNISKGINNLVRRIQGKEPVYEMFSPVKSTTELVCKHCGRIIPIATYYESYRNNDYHLECIWDKLVNKMPENSYEAAEKFFFSLEQYIGNWPAYGYDVEEDYVSDLELVKANNRHLKREPNTKNISSIKETLEYYERLYEQESI